jgi:hypothetical protein
MSAWGRIAGGAIALALTAVLAIPGTAAAKDCNGVHIPQGSLRIDGTLGVDASFTGSIRVIARHDGAQPTFLADDLHDSSLHRIDADQIEIAKLEAPLKKDESRDILITVKGARFAGDYHGAIHTAKGTCHIPITVSVAGAAEVSLVGTGEKVLSLQVVDCRSLTCGLGALDFLTRDAARRDEISPQVENSSQSQAQVTGVQVALSRDPGGNALEGGFTPTSQEFRLPAQSVSLLEPIEIDRNELDPGHYTGAIYLTVLGAEKRVALPLQLDVKVGPLLAILALVGALLVQFLIWLSERSKLKAQELRELRALGKRVRALAPEDQALLEKQLEAARELARDGKIDTAKETRAAIEKYRQWLVSVRTVLTDFYKLHPGRPLPEALAVPNTSLRQAIEEGDTAAAEAAYKEFWAEYGQEAQRAKERARSGGSEILFVDTPQLSADESHRQKGAAKPPGSLRIAWQSFSTAIARLWRPVGRLISLATIYVLPPILRGILVFAFILAGLKELYLDNSTFGSDPFLNYTSLFLWGLTGTGVNALLGRVIPGIGK